MRKEINVFVERCKEGDISFKDLIQVFTTNVGKDTCEILTELVNDENLKEILGGICFGFANLFKSLEDTFEVDLFNIITRIYVKLQHPQLFEEIEKAIASSRDDEEERKEVDSDEVQ